ncbi:hypothetical protein O0I10_002328 [Lichtheimia ornata]|uniref:DH domain-containing protein n=1 Tax=Lichtheimia ornata TaxID=688661 RepID=A0AAD7VCD0_9FUNG|nr:uncharacterized protein O0I10_002328 [Lichtheimia ornata]KAJ8661997.1 hypothetical protein O0I10_002328 [Lichtheimia ornata]
MPRDEYMASSTTCSTSSILASKASSSSSRRQSFLKRFTSPPSPISSSKSTSILPSSSRRSTISSTNSNATAPTKNYSSAKPPTGDKPGRLQSMRLMLIASVSRKRSSSRTSKSDKKPPPPSPATRNNPPPPRPSPLIIRQQKQPQSPSSSPIKEKPSRKEMLPNRRISMICDRNSIHSNMSSICTGSGSGSNSPLSASPTPRPSLLGRRRPMSQFWGLSKVDEDDYDNAEDVGCWRATQGASTTTTLTSNTSDQCSTRSNSTRSSSSSSIRTVSENTNPGSKFLRLAQKAIVDKLPPSSCEQGMPGPSPRAPTPIVSTSSSVYPSRWRDMIRSSVIIGESTTPMSTTTRPASAVGNGPPSPSIITNASSFAFISGTSGIATNNNNNSGRSRRSSLLLSTPSIQKKEVKAISVWRNTVSQLLMQSDENDDYVFYDYPTCTAKDLALCKFIMNELYTTEQSYHRLLTLIQTRYMQPMMAATHNPLVRSSDVAVLFRHLPEMIALSEKLLACFETHATHLWRDCDAIHVGHIFQTLEQDMVVFLKYAVHYQTNLKAIRRACNNVLFIKIEQESLARRDTNRMGMSDYLIAPFQRVPRYCLLIKDLMKHTERADPEYADLDISLKMLTGLTVAMDHVQQMSR